MKDLETILFEFAFSFTEMTFTDKSPVEAALILHKAVRKFAKEHEPKPDLLTQYQQAIDNEQYEVAHILKNQIMEIIEQNYKTKS